MKITITIGNKNIEVQFSRHAVRIVNNNELTGLLTQNAKEATYVLIAAIKQKFRKQFQTDFHVSDASVAVEIWGHVYAGKWAVWMKSHSSVALIHKAAKKIIFHCDTIDIGETGHDSNRFVWDGLSHVASLLARLLPV